VQIQLDIDAMIKRFEFLGPGLRPSVFNALLISAQRMRRDVIEKRLSGPRGAPGILGIVTGAARRSIADEAGIAGETLYALFGSALKYVKAHEEGYKNDAQPVRAHDRRRLGSIKAVSIAKATRGKVIKRGAPTAAQRRSGPIHVRAHTRKVRIVAKHFIRDTLLAAKVPTEERILKALMIAASTGKVPTTSQLGG